MNSGVSVNIHLLKSIKNIVMANSWYEIQAPLFIFIVVCFFNCIQRFVYALLRIDSEKHLIIKQIK